MADDADSEFEFRALSDEHVSRSEYEEAYRLLVTCMEDKGFEVALILSPEGLYSIRMAPAGRDAEAAYAECADGTVDRVATLYNDLVLNPDRRPFDQLVVECLASRGLVDPEFTTSDLHAALEAGDVDESWRSCLRNPIEGVGQ